MVGNSGPRPVAGSRSSETAARAARRETAEELGATNIELVELWTGHSEFDFANRRVSQTETFFLVKVSSEILGPAVQEIHRREGITEVRWWSLDEIDATQELVFPADLAVRVREHVPGAR